MTDLIKELLVAANEAESGPLIVPSTRERFANLFRRAATALDRSGTIASALADMEEEAAHVSAFDRPVDGDLLVIWYRNYRGELSERRIVPKSIRFGATEWHPEPQWLLLAHDLDKQADREFALKDFRAPPAEPSEAQVDTLIAAAWLELCETIDPPSADDPDAIYVTFNEIKAAFRESIFALIAACVTARPGVDGVLEALKGFDDDYMTSEQHNPGYVLIPTAKFEQIRAAIAKLLEPSA